jgi:hypothetical protein
VFLYQQVTYLEYGNTAEVAESSLRPYQPAPVEELKEGTLVKAFWQGLFPFRATLARGDLLRSSWLIVALNHVMSCHVMMVMIIDSFQPAVVVGPGAQSGTIRVKFAKNKKKKDLIPFDIVLR